MLILGNKGLALKLSFFNESIAQNNRQNNNKNISYEIYTQENQQSPQKTQNPLYFRKAGFVARRGIEPIHKYRLKQVL